MCTARAVQPEQGHLDLFRDWVNLKSSPCQSYAAIEVPALKVGSNGPLDDLEVRGVEPITVRSGPILVLEIERESDPRYAVRQALNLIRVSDLGGI